MASSQNNSKTDKARKRSKATAKQAQPLPGELPIASSLGSSPIEAQASKLKASVPDRPTTNPNLFDSNNTSRMASALPIWEAVIF
jgi:hypothetical protein